MKVGGRRILFGLFCLISLMASIGSVSATTIYVNGSNFGTEDGTTWPKGWSTIQEGINNATAGDTVTVSAGTYTENVDVNVSVNLIGAGIDATTISASNANDHVINVSDTDYVNISGFNVTGAGITSGKAGIYLERADYAKIEDIYSYNNERGIELYNSNNVTVANNTVYLVNITTATIYVYGLFVEWYSCDNIITNNTVYIYVNLDGGGSYGFYLERSSNNILSNNYADNPQYGFYIYDRSNYNILVNNTFSDMLSGWDPKLYGFYINQSSHNVLNNNTAYMFPLCCAYGHYGIYLFNASNTIISKSTIYDLGYGVHIIKEDEGPNFFTSRNISILENDIHDNKNGIQFQGGWNNDFNAGSLIANNTLSNTGTGISLSTRYNNNTIVNNTLNSSGISLTSSYYNTITKNTFIDAGINFANNASNNSIYDNLFNDTSNVYFNPSQGGTYSNYWNITKTSGTNIVGGSWIGGNFWAYPNGTGFSESCDDADYDGLCNSSYTLESGNIDYLPLAGIPTLVVTIVAPGNTTYSSTSITFNVTTSLSANVTYSLNGTGNVSLYNESTQGNTTISASEGLNNITVYANDTFGNSETSTVYFTIDTVNPKYSTSQISTNNTEAGLGTLFSVYWTDNSGLSGYIFSTNNTGTWVNESYSFTGTGNWSNVTATLNTTAGLDVGWRIYANDSGNNWNVTDIQVISTTDTAPPKYSPSLISTNNSEVGLGTLFSVYWTDNSGLSGYIFSTNNTGTWANDSFVAMTGTGNWSNITKTLNSTAGLHVGWRIYANDTSDHWNLTPVQVILTTPAETPPPTPPGGGGGGGAAPPKNLAIATVKLVEAGKAAVFAFDEELSEFVSEINLVAKQNAYNVMITMQPMTEKPYSSMPDPKGLVYRYMKVSTAFSDTRIDSAKIKFKIKVSWLKEKDIDPPTVNLNRNYNNKWQVLTTTKTGSDDGYVYYTAETPGFSYFSITAEEGSGYPEEVVPEETPAPTTTPAPTPAPEVTEEKPSPWAMVSPKMFEEGLVEGEAGAPEVEAGEEEESGGFPIFKVFTLIILGVGLGVGGYLLKKHKLLQKKES